MVMEGRDGDLVVEEQGQLRDAGVEKDHTKMEDSPTFLDCEVL